MIAPIFHVALGRAIGATLRYLVGGVIVRTIGVTGFPISILTVNVVGSFLIGVFAVIAAHRGLGHLSPLVMTGVLGGFTTFSAFSLEAVTLYERGDVGHAALYIAASVGLSIGGLMAGMVLGRGVLA